MTVSASKDYRTLAKIREGLFQIHAIFGLAYFRAMLIFESCLFKSHSIFGRAYFQNIWVSLLLKYYLTVILVNCLVLQETWKGKKLFQEPKLNF